MSEPEPVRSRQLGVAHPLKRAHPDGNTILLLGIVGLLGGLIAPFALIKSRRARREMGAFPRTKWTNKWEVILGGVLGLIGSILLALELLGVAVFILVVIATRSG
jgi:hypothetical protein